MEDGVFEGGGAGIHEASNHPDLNQFGDTSTGFASLLLSVLIFLFR